MTFLNSATRAGWRQGSMGPGQRLVGAMLFLLATAVAAAAEPEGWLTSYDEALAAAEQAGKPVLLVFTGSDWCQHCHTLEREVLETDVFRDWAKDRVVRLMIDLPQAGITMDERKARSRICIKYGVRSFPTAVLAGPDGGRLAIQSGYHGQAPAAWVAQFEPHISGATLAAAGTSPEAIPTLDEAVATARDSRRPILVMVSRPGDAAASTRVASLLEDPEFESLARENFVVARVAPTGSGPPQPAPETVAVDELLGGAGVEAELVDIVVTDDGHTPLFTESAAESPQRVVSGLRRFLAARQAARGGSRR